MVKEIRKQLLKTFWINSRINNRKKLYFNSLFLPDFLKSINKQFDISEHFDLNYAFSRSPVKGLINSLFNPNVEFFNALDLSVSINIAINGFCNEKYANNKRIVDGANFICETLKRKLYDDKILKEYLKEMDKNLADFHFNVERVEIEKVLAKKKNIFHTYFKKYHNPNYSTGIIIYHQAETESWINWNKENTITINHDNVEFREGFFLGGFNYKLVNGERLRIASQLNGIEYFNPKEYLWGKNVVWAS